MKTIYDVLIKAKHDAMLKGLGDPMMNRPMMKMNPILKVK